MSTPAPPIAVDLRPNLPVVRDQGDTRGTCVAFAVTAAHEFDREVAGAAAEHLSEEALYWGCKVVDGQWRSGTLFSSAARTLSTTGQPPEPVWPYDPKRPNGVPYAPVSPPDAGWLTSSMAAMSADASTVRSELDAGSPVVLGVVVFDSMFRPTPKGRVELPPAGSPVRGRHAVLAVGYNADALLIRNSWGETWGVDGYGWLTDAYTAQCLRDAWRINSGATGSTTTTAAVTTSGEVYGSG